MDEDYFPFQDEISSILSEQYADFNHFNKQNPLDELIFIICSLKTQEKSYLATYKKFKTRFPKFSDLQYANFEDLVQVFASGGLEFQKAKAVLRIIESMRERNDKFSLSYLRQYSDEECEKELINLYGVGLKSARCVMMYSLNREVFPVDSHIWRITKRLGWNKSPREYRSYSDFDVNYLQDNVKPENRYKLHVNFVSHGRSICISKIPKCEMCKIYDYCQRII